jgi:hypothetical protein
MAILCEMKVSSLTRSITPYFNSSGVIPKNFAIFSIPSSEDFTFSICEILAYVMLNSSVKTSCLQPRSVYY